MSTNGNKMPDYEDMDAREQQEFLKSVFKNFDENNVIYLPDQSETNDED